MDLYQSLDEFIILNTAPCPSSVAKLAERVFNKKYVVHIIGRYPCWFEREDDGTFKRIDSVVIRNRLYHEFPDIIRQAREQFKSDPKYARMDDISQSIEALKLILGREIIDTEAGINYLQQKQNLYRADIKDRKYFDLVNIEDKLYNLKFRNDVIKELEDILYEPHN